MITIGIAAAVVGLVLAFWRGSGIAVISWVVGIAVILIGAFLIYLRSPFGDLGTSGKKWFNRAKHSNRQQKWEALKANE